MARIPRRGMPQNDAVDDPRPRPTEVELAGGTSNHGLVVRVGDTVRRPKSPASAAVHALLRHLERVGFDGAPRLLGTDDEGREVLSFLAGVAAAFPHPPGGLPPAAPRSGAPLPRPAPQAGRGIDPPGVCRGRRVAAALPPRVG